MKNASRLTADFPRLARGAKNTSLRLILLSTAAFAMGPAVAWAQAVDESEVADSGSPSRGMLEEIVITGATNRAQIDSAIAVTKIDSDLIRNFQPSSESEVFRLLPGIQVAGTAGPGGNSNIAVRGLPVTTGGSPLIQIQEDGLPTVLFGDIIFGNNDYWTRFDASVASVEAVRGGSAGTFASQAPGAIINYISHFGQEEGGSIKASKGINLDETRVDFRYGGSIDESLYFHVGGFYKNGRGPLDADFQVSDSIQVKGNLTKEFGGNRGYLRLLFKVADTQEPNYTGAPALATLDGNKLRDVKSLPGLDPRKDSIYSLHNQDQLILNREGNLERVAVDGITTNAVSFGTELHYEFDEITIDNKARWTNMSGGFSSPFFTPTETSSVIGSQLALNGTPFATVSEIRFASGPNAGQVFNGALIDTGVNVTTNVRDIGSFVDDLTLSRRFDAGFGIFSARAGFFFMNQKIDLDWHVNRSTRELGVENPAQLDLFDAAGNQLSVEGLSGFNNNWGNCCSRDQALEYTNQSPYAALDFETDAFIVDGSIRFETVQASGWVIGGGDEFFVDVDGIQIPTLIANGTRENLNYSQSYTSWTTGGLYKITPDFSAFARISRAGRFNADRQVLSGKINPDGSLNEAGLVAAVDPVKQYELGIKNRGEFFGGDYTVEFTLLKARLTQNTFVLDVFGTQCDGAPSCIRNSALRSKGFEFYGTYQVGDFSIIGNTTFSDAQRSLSDGVPFTRTPSLPDLTYTVSTAYDIGEMVSVGLNTSGQTSTINELGISFPGKAIFGGSLTVRPLENLEIGVQAYNLFNTLNFRGDTNTGPAVGNQTIVFGQSVVGRTLLGSVQLNF